METYEDDGTRPLGGESWQVEILRRTGYEDEARAVEAGELRLPPDALAGTRVLYDLADAFQALSDSYNRPRWRVTVRQLGCLTGATVPAESKLQAAFNAGARFGVEAEVVSVEQA